VTLEQLADEARPRPPLTSEQKTEATQRMRDMGYPNGWLEEWSPPAPRIVPETAREQQLYRMGYYDGWTGSGR
jgi:hypothetical protein